MYYSPICIATKALFISFTRNKELLFDENNNINMDKYGESIEKFLDSATKSTHILFNEYDIKEFIA